MSMEFYTRLTAKARALEMIIAAFVAFWAYTVLTYAILGTAPLQWAGLLIFPCCAVLWLIICDWLGLVTDEPEIEKA